MVLINVDGKIPAKVPTPLAGGVVAGVSQRMKARLIDGAILVAVFFILILPPFYKAYDVIRGLGSAEEFYPVADWAFVSTILALVVYGVLGLVTLVLVATKGQTLGMMVAGTRWVDYESGRLDGMKNLGKLLFEGVLSIVLVTPVIWLFTRDETNRHLFNRLSGTITLNIRDGRDTAVNPLPLYPINPEDRGT